MSINKFNSEGYYDPTAYNALKNIAKNDIALKSTRFRPIVYICSPYSGDVTGNVEKARKYCKLAVNKGYIPIAPHLLYPQFMDDNDADDRNLGLFFGYVLMSKCAEVWVCGETVSEGMAAEINHAKRKDYCLRYFNENCEEVQR